VAEPFDGYAEWLGVATTSRPLTHYQLLGLSDFESDPAKIAAAADVALARVRRCQPGNHLAQWQQILDELSMAKLVLCNGARKGQYDGQLRSQLGAQRGKPAPGAATSQAAAGARPRAAPEYAMPPGAAAHGRPGAAPSPAPPASPPQRDLLPPGMGGQPAPAAPTGFGGPSAPAAGFTGAVGPVGYPPASAPPGPGSYPQPNYPQPSYPPASPAGFGPAQPQYSPPQPQAPGYGGAAGQPQFYPGAAPGGAYPQQPGYPPGAGQHGGQQPPGQPHTAQPPYGAQQPYRAPDGSAAGAGPAGYDPAAEAPASRPVPQSPAADAPARAAARRPAETEQVIVRPSTRAPSGSRGESKSSKKQPQGFLSGLSSAQPKHLIIGSVGALALIVTLIILTSPGSPPPEDESAVVAQAERRSHRNPLAAKPPEESEPAKPAGGPVIEYTASDAGSNSPPPSKDRSSHPSPSTEMTSASSELTPPKPAKRKPAEHSAAKAADEHAKKPKADADQMASAATGSGKPASEAMTPDSSSSAAPDAAGAMSDVADPQRAAALEAELVKARGALAARNVPLARDALSAARPLVHTREQRERYEQMQMLLKYVEGFWNDVRKSMAALQPTEEIKIGSTIVAVVSADDKELVVHRGGKNDTYTLDKMPGGIVRMLAERWYRQNDPVNKIYLGAFQLVDPNGEIAEARRLWEEATRGGASAEPLMSLLDLPKAAPLAAGAGRAAAADEKPDKAALSQAEKAFKDKYGPQIRAADDAQKKLDLVDKFLEESTKAEQASERATFFREACDLVAKVARTSNNEEASTAAAKKAIELIDQGIEDKRLDAVKPLGAAAVLAARKSKDDELIKQANERNRHLIEALK